MKELPVSIVNENSFWILLRFVCSFSLLDNALLGVPGAASSYLDGPSLALVVKNEWALNLGPLDHTRTTHVVPVPVSSLDEGVPAVRALVGLLLAMSFLVVDHVAQFRRLDVTFKAPEELICPASRLVHHVVLLEAHVAGIGAVAIAHALLDGLLERWHPLDLIALRRGNH